MSDTISMRSSFHIKKGDIKLHLGATFFRFWPIHFMPSHPSNKMFLSTYGAFDDIKSFRE